jgi:pimeloyl-ACP methyl ester carboxylesterase
VNAVTLPRLRVNHIRQGTGEPLVLVHGIGHRWQAWTPVLDRLAAHHDVIAIDLPGFGESPVPPGGMPRGMAAIVAMMAGYFAAEGLDRPHVAGYSLGGAIALELAVAGQARSATAFSPAGFFTEAERRRTLATLRLMRASTFLPAPLIRRSMRLAAFRAFCYAPLLAHPRRLDYQRAVEDALALRRGRGFRPVARSSRGYRFGAGTPPVPVPLTVAWGAKDRILPPHQAERARALLPEARHVALPGCGHVPMSDDPDLVADLILQTTRLGSPAKAGEGTSAPPVPDTAA